MQLFWVGGEGGEEEGACVHTDGPMPRLLWEQRDQATFWYRKVRSSPFYRLFISLCIICVGFDVVLLLLWQVDDTMPPADPQHNPSAQSSQQSGTLAKAKAELHGHIEAQVEMLRKRQEKISEAWF